MEPGWDEGLAHSAPAKGSRKKGTGGFLSSDSAAKFVLSVLALSLTSFPRVILWGWMIICHTFHTLEHTINESSKKRELVFMVGL